MAVLGLPLLFDNDYVLQQKAVLINNCTHWYHWMSYVDYDNHIQMTVADKKSVWCKLAVDIGSVVSPITKNFIYM